VLKGIALFAEIEKRAGGQSAEAELVLDFVDGDDPVGFLVRKRAKEDRISDAENGGVRANAERERQDGDGGEARRFQELPKGVTEIGDHKKFRLLDPRFLKKGY
jgi:hypothetical protein